MSLFENLQQGIKAELTSLSKKRYSDGGACHEAWEIDNERKQRLQRVLQRVTRAVSPTPAPAPNA